VAGCQLRGRPILGVGRSVAGSVECTSASRASVSRSMRDVPGRSSAGPRRGERVCAIESRLRAPSLSKPNLSGGGGFVFCSSFHSPTGSASPPAMPREEHERTFPFAKCGDSRGSVAVAGLAVTGRALDEDEGGRRHGTIGCARPRGVIGLNVCLAAVTLFFASRSAFSYSDTRASRSARAVGSLRIASTRASTSFAFFAVRGVITPSSGASPGT
jgi:hypothetical protein